MASRPSTPPHCRRPSSLRARYTTDHHVIVSHGETRTLKCIQTFRTILLIRSVQRISVRFRLIVNFHVKKSPTTSFVGFPSTRPFTCLNANPPFDSVDVIDEIDFNSAFLLYCDDGIIIGCPSREQVARARALCTSARPTLSVVCHVHLSYDRARYRCSRPHA